MNMQLLIGRLGAAPDLRYTAEGKPICILRVATSETRKSAGELKERTDWHRCVLRDRLAEIAKDYLNKGDRVYLEGRTQHRKWQDKDGNDRYTTEVMVDEMEMLNNKPKAGSLGSAETSSPEPGKPEAEGDDWYANIPVG